ncbi:MAG: choice-of-anchor Q domain-containing protein, partial [Chloroflexota bacterium]
MSIAKSISRILVVFLVVSLASAGQAGPVRAATWTVTNVNDSGAGSLRQAVASAASGGTIVFDASLSGQTIALVSELAIAKSITIDGSGLAASVEISGSDSVRIFNIGSSQTVTLKSLVLKNGKRTGTTYTHYGGAIYAGTSSIVNIQDVVFTDNTAYEAGAIYVAATATVSISGGVFTSNSSQTDGSAIYVKSRGVVNITDSRFEDNNVILPSYEGTIYLDGSTNSTIERSLFEGNSASSGGAIYIQMANATIVIRRNTFANNTATGASGGGGAVFAWRTGTPTLLTIENNTFYGNSAVYNGGAILFSNSGDVILRNNTFSENLSSRADGNGGGNIYFWGGSDVTLQNNIIADNAGGQDCVSQGSVNTYGSNNLVEDGSSICLPTLTDDPLLGALADNGGPTWTMSLSPDSPAVDAGDDASCSSTDQRGAARPQNAHCDLGAYELDSTVPSVSAIVRADPDPSNAASVDFTVTFSEAVSGVDLADFILATSIGDASIANVSGSEAVYNVTVDTGTGAGTIQLDVVDDDSIRDGGFNPLGGIGAGNGDFAGEMYTMEDNRIPADIQLSNSSVVENLPAGALIGTFSTVDPDAGDTHSYSFTCTIPGADDASFQVGGAGSDELQTAAVFDFEVKSAYNICVRTDDGHGGTFDKAFTITVTDVPDLQLLSPSNGASLNHNRPVFDWLDFPGASAYQFQVSRN